MKGLLSAGGVALILGALLFAGRSSSEPVKPPAPRSRIALVNLAYVIKNYEKVDIFLTEMKDQYAKEEQKLLKLKGEIEEENKKLRDNDLSEQERQAVKQKLDELNLKLSETSKTAMKTLSEAQDKQMVTVYKDIRQATERYAKAHDLELVLQYLDSVKEEDRDNPKNVMVKMQQRAVMPVYQGPGLDISEEIVKELKKSFKEEKAKPADPK